MKNSFLKSLGAILAGFATGFILSVGTDSLLEQTGLMKRDPFSDNPSWLIVIVIAYRTIYNITGCYITAKLAPHHPMRHVMIIGVIGLVFGIIGTIVMWDIPPHWYPIILVILALPSAWVGGKLALRNSINHNN